MANPEHLQILKQGVEAWNVWREQHRDISPELSVANLARADLTKAWRISHIDSGGGEEFLPIYVLCHVSRSRKR
jgi:hypothetical protein